MPPAKPAGAGDLWVADRLQQGRASSSERDWYNR
jgi:hypothetical protein